MGIAVKKYDFYRKAIDGLQTRTVVGGIISIISICIIAILAFMQSVSFLTVKTSTTLNVESQLNKIIPSKLEVSFLEMKCEMVDLHFENIKAKEPLDVKVVKTPIVSGAGVVNGGCLMNATFSLYPGEGNFHVGFPDNVKVVGLHTHMYNTHDLELFNCSHVVHELSFGDIGNENTMYEYMKNKDAKYNHITYFLKMIPVETISLKNAKQFGYDYSMTEYTQAIDGPAFLNRASPGVYFKYQVTPIRMTKKQYRSGFLQYYTTLCSIIGGVITITGIAKSLLMHTVIPSKLD